MFNLTEMALVKIIDKAQKVRTLGERHIVIFAGYCHGSAFLYQRWEEHQPSLRFYGDYFRNVISDKAEISVAEFSYSGSVIFSVEKKGDNLPISGIAFGDGLLDDTPGGCFLIRGKPGNGIIYFHNTYFTAGIAQSIPVRLDESEFLFAKSTVMPFLISYGFKFNWNRLKKEIYE